MGLCPWGEVWRERVGRGGVAKEGVGGIHGDKSQTRVEGLYGGGRDAGRKEGCVWCQTG